MTATSTTTEILTIGPPRSPRWGVVSAAGLAVFAAVALTSWPTTSAETETRQVDMSRQVVPASGAVPPWAPAEPQQAASALRQAYANWNAGTVDRSTAFMQFCHNSPTLGDPTAVTPDPSGVPFCWNSPSPCTLNGRY